MLVILPHLPGGLDIERWNASKWVMKIVGWAGSWQGKILFSKIWGENGVCKFA
jgi:hypothetical protein